MRREGGKGEGRVRRERREGGEGEEGRRGEGESEEGGRVEVGDHQHRRHHPYHNHNVCRAVYDNKWTCPLPDFVVKNDPKATCVTLPSPVSTLTALYNATLGDHWSGNTNWLKNDDYCSWYGVSCDYSGLVTAL